jgi:hypothetical protein
MERFFLTIFLICMPTCAVIALLAIWLGERGVLPEWLFQVAATAFVIGLASFLLWFVHVVYRWLQR